MKNRGMLVVQSSPVQSGMYVSQVVCLLLIQAMSYRYGRRRRRRPLPVRPYCPSKGQALGTGYRQDQDEVST